MLQSMGPLSDVTTTIIWEAVLGNFVFVCEIREGKDASQYVVFNEH